MDGQLGTRSVEVLKLHFSGFAAIHGVSEICAESLDVEWSTPLPTSSSGVKPILIVPCLISGCS